jgi:hypothetical protein
VIGLPKFGWFENFEEITSRLKRKPLGKAELAAQGQVPLSGTEAAQGVASEIVLRGGRHRCAEGSRVDDLASGRVWLIEVEGRRRRVMPLCSCPLRGHRGEPVKISALR